MIVVIFTKSMITPIGAFSSPSETYNETPFFQGFLDGYLTMDALAALVFGIVVANTIRAKGVQDPKQLSKYMSFAGIGAGILLASIYGILSYLGASSASVGQPENGAQVLTIVMNELFGQTGILMLGLLFTLACLCVCIGLIISCSQYFSETLSFLSYKGWAVVLAIVSMIVANMGLTQILSVSVPISLGLINNYIPTHVYFFATLFTGLFSLVETINYTFLGNSLDSLLRLVPLYDVGVGWVLPAVVGGLVGLVVPVTSRKLSNEGI
jgi:LIVCS family branched-chain amino acid:cation transporter